MNRQERIDAEIKKAIDGRTKEFKEKIAKLAYEKIKAALTPSKEPLKGYPHNESVEEETDSKEFQQEIDMIAKMIKKGEHERLAKMIKRDAKLKKGGGWNMAQRPSKKQKDMYNKMVRDHKKKHRSLYASYNEEFTISLDESVLAEKLRAGRGMETIDIDYIGNSGDRSRDMRAYRIKIKMTGRQTADVTGMKKDILAFLQGDAYRMDDEDIEEIFPELLEAMVNELNARYDLSDMKQSKDPKVKRELAKLMKTNYASIAYIRQYKEVEAALDKSLPAHKRKK